MAYRAIAAHLAVQDYTANEQEMINVNLCNTVKNFTASLGFLWTAQCTTLYANSKNDRSVKADSFSKQYEMDLVDHIFIKTILSEYPLNTQRTLNCTLSFQDRNYVSPSTEIENTSRQASNVCDSLRGLTSISVLKTQWNTALRSLHVS